MTRYCTDCHAEREFDCPPCADGHDDCPERFCVVCGAAVLVSGFDAAPAARPARQGAAA